jgi:hypothetical protein
MINGKKIVFKKLSYEMLKINVKKFLRKKSRPYP